MKSIHQFPFFLIAVCAANVAIAGNLDVDFHCVARRVDQSNWIYSSGAKPNAQDTLVGLAVRVYQGGQRFAEFANPSTLLKGKVE